MTDPIPFQEFEGGIKRPCLYVRIEDPNNIRCKTNLVQMIVDTGSDLCIFDKTLADELEIDLRGAQEQRIAVAGGGFATFQAWNVRIVLPQIGYHFLLSARFGQFHEGYSGILGRHGFLRWVEICFRFNEALWINEVNSRDEWGAIPVGPRPVT